MSIITYINRMKLLDQYIHRQETGTPFELANKLKLSKRSLYHYLQMMKSLGAPISYNKQRLTYTYDRKVRLKIFFSEFEPN
jgi:transcriptional antiterminator